MVSEAAKKRAALKKASIAAKHGGATKTTQKTPNSFSPPPSLSPRIDSPERVNDPVSSTPPSETISVSEIPKRINRVSFPPALTPRQRAVLHELAEENGLQHRSLGETENTRKLIIWRETEEGEEGESISVSFEKTPVTDFQVAETVSRLLGLDGFTKFGIDKSDISNANGISKYGNSNGYATPDAMSNASLKTIHIERISLEEFVTKMSPLIQLEKEAEIQASMESCAQLKPEVAAKRGIMLLGLKCTEAEAGLLGKTLLVLESNRGLLPSHKFHPHDVVSLKPNRADSSSVPLCNGVIYRIRDNSLTVAVDDLPDDGLDGPLRIEKLANDVTYKRMKDTLIELSKGVRSGPAADLVPVLFGEKRPTFSKKVSEVSYFNKNLDESQRMAVQLALSANDVALLHGPPGTGKTTAVVEIILHEVKREKKVLVCAASNIAVDNLVERLSFHNTNSNKSIKIVRLGHPARLLPSVLSSALDSQVLKTDNSALANDVRKEIQTLNRQLLKVRDKRERAEMRRELKRLAKEEVQRQQKAVNDVIKDSNVVLTTLTGVLSRQLYGKSFDVVVIDEAAQALEVACWIGILKARKVLLAGDHLQLPPTVQSKEAEKSGFSITLFERLISLYGNQITALLTTQYRMHADIMQWSSSELYENKLIAHAGVASRLLTHMDGVLSTSIDASPPLILIDTSGCDMEESREEDGDSWRNEGEATVIIQHAKRLIAAGVAPDNIGIITPYSAQVSLLKEMRGADNSLTSVEISTVDGFQGREKAAILISMVRCNPQKEVGFLADNRRMNVAVTRAQRQCCVVCDSDTVSSDPFLKRMLDYFEKHGELLSAMEYVS